MEIYPLDSVIYPSNNRARLLRFNSITGTRLEKDIIIFLSAIKVVQMEKYSLNKHPHDVVTIVKLDLSQFFL